MLPGNVWWPQALFSSVCHFPAGLLPSRTCSVSPQEMGGGAGQLQPESPAPTSAFSLMNQREMPPRRVTALVFLNPSM